MEHTNLYKIDDIFHPKRIFSIIEKNNFNNFVITRKGNYNRKYANELADLMTEYNKIECGKITNKMYNDKHFNTSDSNIFKWNDIETSNIIDKFLEYEFNENTFGNFVTELFPGSTDDIIIYFEILSEYGECIQYKIKIPIEKYKYNYTKPICIDVLTGFYGI